MIIHSSTSIAQFIDPESCVLIESDSEFEKKLTFCQISTDSTREVYQIRNVTLIAREGYSKYDKKVNGFKDCLIRSDTFNAYLIDGIYRSYYPNDSLKAEGLYTTMENPDDKRIDTFEVFYSNEKENSDNWNYTTTTSQFIYTYRCNLIRIGEWFWYYENGKVKTRGHYSIMFDKSFSPDWSDYEGGPITSINWGHEHKKDGLWIDYDKNGKIKKKFTFLRDYKSNKLIQVELK